MTDSIARDLAMIRSMPYGTARTAAAETLAKKIEAEGMEEHLPEALLDLVEAYTFAYEGPLSFVTFSKLLRLWDSSPELFDDVDRRNMFWEFKWIAADLPHYPQITMDQAHAFLDDMERRYSLAGNGLSAVRMSRFRWEWHAGLSGVESARLKWMSGAKDEFDDCAACNVGMLTDYLTGSGRHAEAVEVGLTQKSSCNLEPTSTYHALALSALLTDQPDLALRTHRQARSTIDGVEGEFAFARGQSFELLARGGHLDRALRELRNDYPGLLQSASTPLFQIRFWLGVLAGLSACLDRGDVRTGLRTDLGNPEWGTVAELHQWVSKKARALGAEFDARSNTAYYAKQLEQALNATPAPSPLPFADEMPSQPVVSTRSDQTTDSGLVQFEWAEAAAARKEFGAASQYYERAAQEFEAAGHPDRTGISLAEAAQCAAMVQDDPRAHVLFGAAVARLRAGGAEQSTLVAVVSAWARAAARLDDREQREHLLITSQLLAEYRQFDPIGMTPELADRRKAEWSHQRAVLRDTLARSIASADSRGRPEGLELDRAEAEATSAGEEFARMGMAIDAAHAFWLAGRIQREQGQSESAIWSLESAFEGFTAIREQDARIEVAGELIELLRETDQAEYAERITAQLTE